jgi:hypothetical protein
MQLIREQQSDADVPMFARLRARLQNIEALFERTEGLATGSNSEPLLELVEEATNEIDEAWAAYDAVYNLCRESGLLARAEPAEAPADNDER